MEQEFREKIMPTQWIWCLVKNLDKFDDKPELILQLIWKFNRIEDHRLLSTFRNLFDCIERCYKQTNKFRDTTWLTLNFKRQSQPLMRLHYDFVSLFSTGIVYL